MGVLGRMTLAAIALGGCYSPELRDCIVACTATSDCAPDQVCGSDGRCAAPDLAGRCMSLGTTPDGATPGPVDASIDARPMIDAAPPVDAAPMQGSLRIKIGGRGYVVVDNTSSLACSFTAPGAECTFLLPPGVKQLRAYADSGMMFERWMGACMGNVAVCNVTLGLAPPTFVEAKFKNDNSGSDDD